MTDTIFVTQSSMPDFQEYCDEIADLWESRHLTNMGPKHQRLQQLLQDYFAVNHVELTTNGHMALELSLEALQLTGEVITTPFTFASTTQAIIRSGLTPVFCDINPDDFTIDTSAIEDLITDRTSAIMPVHVYGNVCDVEKIADIAARNSLKVIYDAAHAFGVTYKGRPITAFGDVSCFSFHATKVFNTIEGGAACFNDDAVGARLRTLRNFGAQDNSDIPYYRGLNAKMNEFCAAMGLCNFRHVEAEIAKRKTVVEHYRKRLSALEGLQLNASNPDVVSNYAYFPVVFHEDACHTNRDNVMAALADNNIYARKYFHPLTSDFEGYPGNIHIQPTPVAASIAEKVLTLPLYADMTAADVDRICDIIESLVR